MSRTIVPNGNVCLTFKDSISQNIAQFAARHFSDIADGYLIGTNCVPHLTLCQIYHDKPQPRALRRDLGTIAVPAETIRLEAVTHRTGTGPHDGFTWLEFQITPTPEWVADMKFEVETILRKYDIPSLTAFGPDYRPHVTLCRMKTSGDVINVAPNIFTIEPAQMHFSLGSSDANGQVQKIYWKKQLA